eukprot:PhM_4_TR5612/c0_g1_i1/m.4005
MHPTPSPGWHECHTCGRNYFGTLCLTCGTRPPTTSNNKAITITNMATGAASTFRSPQRSSSSSTSPARRVAASPLPESQWRRRPGSVNHADNHFDACDSASPPHPAGRLSYNELEEQCAAHERQVHALTTALSRARNEVEDAKSQFWVQNEELMEMKDKYALLTDSGQTDLEVRRQVKALQEQLAEAKAKHNAQKDEIGALRARVLVLQEEVAAPNNYNTVEGDDVDDSYRLPTSVVADFERRIAAAESISARRVFDLTVALRERDETIAALQREVEAYKARNAARQSSMSEAKEQLREVLRHGSPPVSPRHKKREEVNNNIRPVLSYLATLQQQQQSSSSCSAAGSTATTGTTNILGFLSTLP